jgi:Ca2+-binding EF-hand superfamily protein
VDKLVQLEKTLQMKKIYDSVDLEAMEDELDQENYKDFDAEIAFGHKNSHQHLEPISEEALL